MSSRLLPSPSGKVTLKRMSCFYFYFYFLYFIIIIIIIIIYIYIYVCLILPFPSPSAISSCVPTSTLPPASISPENRYIARRLYLQGMFASMCGNYAISPLFPQHVKSWYKTKLVYSLLRLNIYWALYAWMHLLFICVCVFVCALAYDIKLSITFHLRLSHKCYDTPQSPLVTPSPHCSRALRGRR